MLADIILKIHASLKTASKLNDYKTTNKVLWALCGAFTENSGALIYACYKFRSLFKIYPEALDGSGDTVVSMTSFPKRMRNIWMTIDMIMRQSTRPAKIYLYLAECDFPDRKLPESLAPYIQRGLEVVFVPENLRSHLKYHYAFKNEAEGLKRNVVTLDDDLFYPADTIERLEKLHERYPEHICANFARHITKDSDGFRPYSEWKEILYACEPEPDMIALGFGGVLYPASYYCRTDSPLFDTDTMRSLSYKADDLWLKACQMTQGVLAACGDYAALPPSIPSTQGISLSQTNCAAVNPGNDIAWKALTEHFNL